MRKIESFLNRRCLLKKKPIGKKNTAIALILAWFCAILLVIVVCGIVLPHLIAAITTVAEGISHAPEILKEILKELGIKSDSLNISSIFSKLGDVASNILGQLTAVLNGAVSFFTGAILSIYMLANKSRLKEQAVRMVTAYLPGKSKKNLRYCAAYLQYVYSLSHGTVYRGDHCRTHILHDFKRLCIPLRRIN